MLEEALYQSINELLTAMTAMFYIGISLVFLSFIPWLLINGKMMRDKKEYGKLPLKMNEIETSYKRKRFYLMLFQMLGIIIAILGLLL